MGYDPAYTIIPGSASEVLDTLAAGSVDCIITSPPYWGQRTYGAEANQLWGGDPNCLHDFDDGWVCGECGGWWGELGKEAHPGGFLTHLWGIFDQCWRVLKDTGTLWVNLGDTYYGGGCDATPGSSVSRRNRNHPAKVPGRKRDLKGLDDWCRPKQLLLVPAHFAIGMCERRWICRNEIIWAKYNHRPESAADRFSYSHEHVWLFAKQRNYHFDYAAVMDPTVDGEGLRRARDVWMVGTSTAHLKHFAAYGTELPRRCILAGVPAHVCADCGAPYKPDGRRTCRCESKRVRPGVVLDPFCGSGTTLMVAKEEGRSGVGIEPISENVEMARGRVGEAARQMEVL